MTLNEIENDKSKDKIIKVTISMGIPILISSFSGLLYSMVNLFFLSCINRNSTDILSGISLVIPITYFFSAIANGLAIGISSFVARTTGENDEKKLKRIMSSIVFLCVSLSVFLLIAGYVSCDGILDLFAGKGISQNALNIGKSYLLYIIPGYIFLIVGQSFIGVLWGEGKTIYLGITILLSNVLNIALDLIFIFIFKMGVKGAGIATTISILITGLYVFYLFMRNKSQIPVIIKFSLIDIDVIKEIVKIGFSQIVGLIYLSFVIFFLNNIVGSIGQNEMTSWGICNRLDQIVLLPVFAIGGANIVMISRNFGSRNWRTIKRIYLTNCILSLCVVMVLSLAYIAISPLILEYFTGIKLVKDLCLLQIRIVSISFLGLVLEIITINTFQGIKKTVPVFMITFIRMFLVEVPVSYFFVNFLHIGIKGVFFGIFIAHIIGGSISFFWLSTHIKFKINSNIVIRGVEYEKV